MMRPKHRYKVRPGYGTKNLLIEFNPVEDSEYFLFELMKMLSLFGFEQQGKIDLWMNDEILVTMRSMNGCITLSLDIYGIIFILATNNQTDILRIDGMLQSSKGFEKEEVDFTTYRMPL